MNIKQTGFGRMGQIVSTMIDEKEDMQETEMAEADVIIDFSHPDMLQTIIEAEKPSVIATTGYTDEQTEQIKKLAEKVPVVFSANYSLGITVMKRVLSEIAPILEKDFDMELIEAHHNQKLDAPSGTAKMLVDAMDPNGEYERVYGRSGMAKRQKEIGVHAIRGGTIAGEHQAIFAGEDEILEITHKAGSRRIFAAGALKAAEFVCGRKPGLYTMDDILFGEK